MSARTIFRKFGRVAATAGIAAFLSVAAAFVVMKFFTIETIEMHGTGVDIIVDQKKLTKNLLFFPTEQLKNQLLMENPILTDVIIQKKLPHTLVIITKLRTPIARLQTTSRSVNLDADGMIISDSVPGVLLPTLSFEVSPIKIGQKISNSQISAALDAIERLGPTVPINSITALDSQSLQITSGTLRIYITQQEHMSEVSSTLQTILAGFRIKGTLPAVIDLRFAKPVISY